VAGLLGKSFRERDRGQLLDAIRTLEIIVAMDKNYSDDVKRFVVFEELFHHCSALGDNKRAVNYGLMAIDVLATSEYVSWQLFENDKSSRLPFLLELNQELEETGEFGEQAKQIRSMIIAVEQYQKTK
jgi:hypothetical protein